MTGIKLMCRPEKRLFFWTGRLRALHDHDGKAEKLAAALEDTV